MPRGGAAGQVPSARSAAIVRRAAPRAPSGTTSKRKTPASTRASTTGVRFPIGVRTTALRRDLFPLTPRLFPLADHLGRDRRRDRLLRGRLDDGESDRLAHLRLDLGRELRILFQELFRVLAPLADPEVSIGEPRAGLLDDL